jgi:ribonucleoside-diphosphate reductase alpha chain
MRRLGKNGQSLLKQNYLKFGETTLDDVFHRAINEYASSHSVKERCLEYAKKGWFCFSTPALSNAGNPKAMPVACFLLKMADTKEDISYTKKEIEDKSFAGGGVSVDLSSVRSQGTDISGGGKTAGITAQIKAIESIVKSAQQGGSNRRGACAVYLSIHHPEIEQFLQMRNATSGEDISQKSLSLHHCVIISDDFMEAVKNNTTYDIICPHKKQKIDEKKARDIWKTILKLRIETGEPYLFFQGNADKLTPEIYKRTGRRVTQSNLCTEILLHTDNDNTAVCVLLSVNLEMFDDWKHDSDFITDMMRLLSGINGDFLYKVDKYLKDRTIPDYKKAYYTRSKNFAEYERSVGLGVMGWQYYLQKNNIPFDSEEATALNQEVFHHISTKVNSADEILAFEYGTVPLANQAGMQKHFSLRTAIAPTETISQLLDTTPSVEPITANIFNKEIATGTYTIKNFYLEKLLIDLGKDNDETWTQIIRDGGSVKNLDFLTGHQKSVFKTAYEINQEVLIKQAIDRQKYIDQGQSLNIFVTKNVTEQELHNLHKLIYEGGLVTAYYLRSQPAITAKVSESKFDCTAEICEACQ